MHLKYSIWTPLSPTVFYALIALYHNPLHAYLVGEQIAKYSQGLVMPNRSTTGRLLRRIVDRGWATAASPPAYPRSLRRKIYSLTPAGRRGLKNELERLRYMVSLTSYLDVNLKS